MVLAFLNPLTTVSKLMFKQFNHLSCMNFILLLPEITEIHFYYLLFLCLENIIHVHMEVVGNVFYLQVFHLYLRCAVFHLFYYM